MSLPSDPPSRPTTPSELEAGSAGSTDGERTAFMDEPTTPLQTTSRLGATRSPAAGGAATTGGATAIEPGMLLGHTFEVEALIAQGGMGAVYRARHVELDTTHAIKVILPDLARDQRLVDLFRREASVLRQVRHDAIVAYDGINRDEIGRLYLVMEFVDGPSLTSVLRDRCLSVAEAGILLDRLASGLAIAHEKGVVHRDLSPDNIILAGGRIDGAKIIDFGIAKQTAPDARTIIGQGFAGKFSYASPEQIGMFGGVVDARSDVYSLALVIAASVRGKPIDMGDSPQSVVESRLRVPDLVGIPEPLCAVLTRMLTPDPAQRAQSVSELIGTCSGAATTIVGDKRPAAGPKGETKAEASKGRGGIIAGVVAGVLVLGGGAAYLALQPPAPTAETAPVAVAPQTSVAQVPAPTAEPAVPQPTQTMSPSSEPSPRADAPLAPPPSPEARPAAPVPAPAPAPEAQPVTPVNVAPAPVAPPAIAPPAIAEVKPVAPVPQARPGAPVPEAQPVAPAPAPVAEVAPAASPRVPEPQPAPPAPVPEVQPAAPTPVAQTPVVQSPVAQPLAAPAPVTEVKTAAPAPESRPAVPPSTPDIKPATPAPAPETSPPTGPTQVAALPTPRILPSLGDLRAAFEPIRKEVECSGLYAHAASDGRFAVSGFAGAEKDVKELDRRLRATSAGSLIDATLTVRPWPFCEAMRIAAPSERALADDDFLVSLNNADGNYRDGDTLMVAVRLGNREGYLTVDYLDLEGAVVHMVPMPLRRADRIARGQSLTLGADPRTAGKDVRYYTISAPFGPGMILAILSAKPMFQADRPEVETAAEYLPKLRERLSLLASDAVSTRSLFFTTFPR